MSCALFQKLAVVELNLQICKKYFAIFNVVGHSLPKLKFSLHLFLVPVRYNELAEPIARACAEAHSARLHRWRVDSNLC